LKKTIDFFAYFYYQITHSLFLKKGFYRSTFKFYLFTSTPKNENEPDKFYFIKNNSPL